MSNELEITLSGIRPTGRFHLGNYLGALRHWVDYQKKNRTFYIIVDLHALTEDYSREELKTNRFLAAANLLAIGIDPNISTLFFQSQVAEHSELTWILSNTVSFGELSRMTQFKEKSGAQGGREYSRASLFFYPVLMAADILLYQAKRVPVGEDQRQHLELTRNIAQRFNNRFGDTFTIPEAAMPEIGSRIMDLQNPLKKMSKTSSGDMGTIYLDDSDDQIRKKIARAQTDSEGVVVYDPENRPGVSNLLAILASIEGRDPHKLAGEFQSYKSLKDYCQKVVIEHLSPIRERIHYFEKNKDTLYEITSKGAKKARRIANATLAKAKENLGFT